VPSLQIRSFDQILQRMATRLLARTTLTDLNDSSSVKHILAAAAREIGDVYFQFTRLTDLFDLGKAAGADLDARAKEIQPGTLRRLAARKSIGSVVFSRTSNTGQTLIIPTGTVVKASNGQSFVTTEPAVISSTSAEVVTGHGVGRDSSTTTALAQTAGVAGNVSLGAVIGFQSKPAGISEVANVTAFIQGAERESDGEFKARIRTFILSLARSTIDALEFISKNVVAPDGRVSIFTRCFEDVTQPGNVTLYVDDGAGTAESSASFVLTPILPQALGGEVYIKVESPNFPIRFPESTVSVVLTRNSVPTTLTQGTDWFLNPANGLFYVPAPSMGGILVDDIISASFTYYTGLIAAVQKVIDGDANDRANFPGYRAAGILVRVRTPDIISFSVQAVITLSSGNIYDVSLACQSAVLAYVNSLGISGDVIRNELIDRIMEVDGVYDVSLIAPLANISVLDSQLPRITTANISIT